MLNIFKYNLNKKLLIVILLLSVVYINYTKASTLAAPIGKIYGKVVDSANNPIEIASVYLTPLGSKISNMGTYTKEDGTFILENVKYGKYQLIVSFIGYNTFTSQEISIDEHNTQVNTNLIRLTDSNKKLEDVVITDQKKLVEIKTDRIVYNAEQDITNAGGSATDVLRKVPLVNVDAQGNVDLRGNTDLLILINGKPSPIFTNSLSDALETLPADQIKKIEVITTPSAKYGSEGSKGIINIITKEEKQYSGINGNINLSASKRSRANLGLNYYNKKFSASLMSSVYGSFKSYGSYNFNKNIYNPTNNNKYINTSGKTASHRLGILPYLTLNYNFDNLNTLSSSLMFANRKGFNNQNVEQKIRGISNNIISEYYNQSDRDTKSDGVDWTLSYVKRFSKENQELNLDYNFSHSTSNTDLNGNSFIDANLDTLLNNALSNNLSNNLDNSLTMFYSHPIKKTIKIEAGSKATLRKMDTKYNYTLYKDTNANNVIGSIVNKLDFNQNIYAGYIMFNYNINTKTSLIAGSRIEYTHNKAAFTNNNLNHSLNNNYNNIMPSLALVYKLNDMSSVKLNYRRGIYRPTIKYLNPYEDRTDSLNIKQGNPDLLPENNDLVELGYNLFFNNIPIANIIAFYQRTSNAIEPVTNNLANGASLTTYYNIGTQTNLGLSLLSSYRFFKTLTLRGELSLFNSNYSNISNKDINSSKYISYKANLMASYSIINNLSAELFFIFNSPRYIAQGKRPSFSIISLGLRKNFTKNLSMNLSVSNPFKENIDFITESKTNDFEQTAINSIPFRFISIGIRYKFGKLNEANINKNQNKDIFSDNKETNSTENAF
ncbi:MAG: TonB-dependent receptor domain-containing protein [Solitalea-like symbiont of Tyrophagus putrescentiae]